MRRLPSPEVFGGDHSLFCVEKKTKNEASDHR